MSLFARRLTALTFALAVTFGLVGASPATVSAADLTISQAEREMVKLLNAQRAKAGLVPVRIDTRLMSIARKRSADMAARHYFSHTQPDGRTVFDLISAAGIKWYAAGEIIAWNNASTLTASAAYARDGWMNSSGHRSVVMSNTYNYVGVGLAIDASNGKKLWTGVFMKGPDRTGGWVKLSGPRLSIASDPRYDYATFTWTGGDIRLVVLTAGFRKYQTQIRTNGGSWKWISTGTTSTKRTIRIRPGHYRDFRVRACDKAGNCGAWQTKRVHG